MLLVLQYQAKFGLGRPILLFGRLDLLSKCISMLNIAPSKLCL